MSDDRSVFGISSDPYGDRQYVFVRVDAIVEERRLRTNFDPIDEFPTEGNIFVGAAFLPGANVAAVWRVRMMGVPRPGPRQAEWSAVARVSSVPLEVISLPLPSSQVTGVRQQLFDGFELGYVPSSSVLVRLLDGVIVGPVRGGAYEESGTCGFRAAHDAFIEPLRAWDTAVLNTFQVESNYALDRSRRSFACDLDLPESQRWIDLAEFRDTVRSVLKPLTGPESRLLTTNQLREISNTLQAEDYHESIRTRVDRVRRAVQSLSLSQEEIEELMPAVLADPGIAKELERTRQSTADAERSRIAAEQHKLVGEVQRLRKTEKQLRQTVEALNEERTSAEDAARAAADTAADAAVEEVHLRVQDAMSNAGKVLADIALLRPFLASPTEAPEPVRLKETGSAASAGPQLTLHRTRWGAEPEEELDEVKSPGECAQRLARDLKAGGVAPNTAGILSKEVVATLLAGQMPIFAGSLASTLAEIVCRSLGGAQSRIVEVPLGLASHSPLRAALDEATGASNGHPPSLLLEGIDRSAIEIYGGPIRESIARRLLANDFEAVSLSFVASMCGGPACLPLSPGVFDLGPVIDTDMIKYSNKGGSRVPLRRALPASLWNEWRAELASSSSEVRESTEAACDELSLASSMLWRRGARTASGYLGALYEGEEGAVSVSVYSRWIVPRALSEGIEPETIATRLRGLGVPDSVIEGEGSNSGVSALLQRAHKIRNLGA